MKKFNKICIFVLAGLLIFAINFSNARPKFRVDTNTGKDTTPTFSGEVPSSSFDAGSHPLSDKLRGILKFPEKEDYPTSLEYVLHLIKISINWILGILSFVALVYMLYCGFLIFSSGTSDKNTQKGKKGISTAAIALAGIGLSRLIVSAMIRFITILSKPS